MTKAKEIFDNYAGSKFQMMREGVIKEYEQYNVSPELESQWLNELVEIEFKKLDINDFNTFFPLSYIIQHHTLTDQISRVRGFIAENMEKAQSADTVNLFINKVISILSDPSNIKFQELNNELMEFKRLRMESNPNNK